MDWFPAAIGFTMGWEDPDLTGAVTVDNNGKRVRFGFNEGSYPGDPIYSLPVADAFWRGTQLGRAIWVSQKLAGLLDRGIATAVFDQTFNGGGSTGVRLLQSALNGMGAALTVDGNLGPLTLDAVLRAGRQALLDAFVAEAGRRYSAIAKANPADGPCLAGWLARAGSY